MTQSIARDTATLHDAVREIVVQELEVEPDELTGAASFEDDYEADSLSLLAVVARLERELGIVVPSDEIGRMTTLDNVLELVAEHTGVTGG